MVPGSKRAEGPCRARGSARSVSVVDEPEPGGDAPLPPEMARRAEAVGVAKASMPIDRMVVLAVLGGAFISLGAAFSTVVTAGGDTAFGVSRLLGGVTFALGLALVVAAGAELFTGNTLVVMAVASRRVRIRTLLRSWVIVYAGNLAGAVATAALVVGAEQYRQGDGAVARRVIDIAGAKLDLDFVPAILLGVLANALVCLAVWLSLAARTLTDKVVAVIPPVAAFVALGFEHSVANMYFVPTALFVRSWSPDGYLASVGADAGRTADLSWTGFVVDNLVPVTIGNVIGGAGLVGIVYWLAYLRRGGPLVPGESGVDT